MNQNKSGKVLTIFIVIIVVLLMTLTALSLFFYQKEIETRELTELVLRRTKAGQAQVQLALEEANKQIFLFEEKNKEADERINSLLDDLDLEAGLRDELKLDNVSLKEELEKEKKLREDLQVKLKSEDSAVKEEIKALKERLDVQLSLADELRAKIDDYETRSKDFSELSQGIQESSTDSSEYTQALQEVNNEVDLDKIVVMPQEIPDGRVLSVDVETEFIIVNLGEKDGVLSGHVLSVYRGQDYLGDVRITRVQPEMSAADLIPPFSSRVVRKNDQVVSK